MFKDELAITIGEYLNSSSDLEGQIPSKMLIDFVIEKYKQRRNYPPSFKEEMIEEDLFNHKTTIAMAVIDMFSKLGAEGEKSHSENGVTRNYENAYISTSIFIDVLPYVNIF